MTSSKSKAQADVIGDVIVGAGRSAAEICAAIGLPGPTPEQTKIIQADAVPLLVTAGAGSGKTQTLALRVLWVLDNAKELFGHWLSPEQVLALTFTRKAAAEIAARVWQQLGALYPEQPIKLPPTISTYNSFANNIVREHGLVEAIDPSATLVTDAILWQIADDVVQQWQAPLELDYSPSSIVAAVVQLSADLRDHQVDRVEFANWLENACLQLAAEKNPRTGKMLGDASRIYKPLSGLRQLLPLVAEFERRKQERNLLDFADQVAAAVAIVQNPDIAQDLRARYPIVLLDEFQDTAALQLKLFRDIFGAGAAVTAVGDPQQAIYGFRGANAAALGDFAREFATPEHEVEHLNLTISWRNEPAVLEVANRVGAHSAGTALRARFDYLEVPAPVREHHSVEAGFFDDLPSQLGAIVDFLRTRCAELAAQRPNSEPVTAAVLCRTKAIIPHLVAALHQADIPYQVVGLKGLIDTPEIADLRALLAVSNDPARADLLMRLLTGERIALGPRDVRALAEWAGELSRRHGPGSSFTLVDALMEEVPAGWTSETGYSFSPLAPARLALLRDAISRVQRHPWHSVADQVEFAAYAWDLDIELMSRPNRNLHTNNLEAFLGVARQYDDSADLPTLSGFLDYLELADKVEQGLEQAEISADPSRVQILTIHAAKGLEWDVVAVPQLEVGTFPSVNFNKSLGAYASNGYFSDFGALPFEFRSDSRVLPHWQDLQLSSPLPLKELNANFATEVGSYELAEESRLFYVAVTRARTFLHLSGTRTVPTTQTEKSPAPWLASLLDDIVAEPEKFSQMRTVVSADIAEIPTLLETRDWPAAMTSAQQTRQEVAAAMADATRLNDAQPDQIRTIPAVILAERLLAEQQERKQGASGDVALTSLSASALVAYDRDAAEFLLQVRRPIPTPPGGATRIGTALHQRIQDYYAAPTLIELEPRHGRAEDRQVANLFAKFRASEWANRQPLAVEFEVEGALGGLPLRTRIDAVFPAGNGVDKVTLVDWKTGKAPAPADRRRFDVQLSVYRQLWADLHGISPEAVDAVIYFVSSGDTYRPARFLSPKELADILRRQ